METSAVIYKKCARCNQEKPLWEFGVDKKKTLGVKDYCKECWEPHLEDIKNNEKKEKEYKEQLREKNRLLRIEEKKNEKIRKAKEREQYKKENEEKKILLRKIKGKEYREKNKDRIKIRKKEYHLKKINSDPLYKLKFDIRRRIYHAFRDMHFSKNNNSENILGCSFEEFKLHIEKQFEPWMTWKNHGVYTGEKKISWHLDHIIPMASAKTIEDVIRLNHYTNFQPLDSYDNQVLKRDKIDWI